MQGYGTRDLLSALSGRRGTIYFSMVETFTLSRKSLLGYVQQATSCLMFVNVISC